MKLETYFEGQVIETREIDDMLSSPNLAGFIIQMMSNAAYNQLIQTNSNQLATNRLEIAIVRLELKSDVTTEDLSLFKFLWDSAIEGSTIPLDNSDLIKWNQIAKSNNIPFNFGEDFKIKLNEK